MHVGAFEQLAAILVVSAAAAPIAMLLRQPLLLGLLVAGIALGPGVLGLVRIDESITLLAEVGIALLLFIVDRSDAEDRTDPGSDAGISS
jgi:glutathione-regulated potassium-efflux system protein KefB